MQLSIQALPSKSWRSILVIFDPMSTCPHGHMSTCSSKGCQQYVQILIRQLEGLAEDRAGDGPVVEVHAVSHTKVRFDQFLKATDIAHALDHGGEDVAERRAGRARNATGVVRHAIVHYT